MKKLYFVSLFLILTFNVLYSQDKGSGLGIMLGEPSGITLKQWLTEPSAIDVGIAYSFVQTSSFQVQLDYVLHNYNLVTVARGKLPFYYGVGGRIKLKSSDKADDVRVGVRVPFGLDYQFPNDPVDIFLEIVPVVDFTPVTKLTFNGDLGVRYFFNN
jgi:hypothetical protein